MTIQSYDPKKFGGEKEELMMKKFRIQLDDANTYFDSIVKPRLDRHYKIYISDTTDRAKEIQKWQSNVSVPYVHGVIETMKPRILDASPEFSVLGRNADDNLKASKVSKLGEYTWEKAEADKVAEQTVSSSLIFGTGFMQVRWKNDTRTLKFLKTKNINGKQKLEWKTETKTFYDAPTLEWIDNYDIRYDWRNVSSKSKQYWFRRLVLCGSGIKRRYPLADKKRLEVAFASGQGDISDVSSVRQDVKIAHEKIVKGADWGHSAPSKPDNSIAVDSEDYDNMQFEVWEWLRPFEDSFSVHVGREYVPIFKNAEMPNPYDFKETTFIEVPYLLVPGEFEGYGIPAILENAQISLNTMKNQRIDAATLNVHKMWVVNPLANVDKSELVTRPMGIIYSPDPNGVREIQTGDIKPSAYKEEELLKGDMRHGAGVDDMSMGSSGGPVSATATRHLRESTLERVRLFINHLGDAYSKVLRYWISMYRQFWTNDMIIRIVGDNGDIEFPLIEKDDLMGEFDFKSTVIPSIAGQMDIDKKQNMDLFQLLSTMPFIDLEKLTTKTLHPWKWTIEDIKKTEESQVPENPMLGMMGAQQGDMLPPPKLGKGVIPEEVAQDVLRLLGDKGGQQNQFGELSSPVNLLEQPIPPTAPGINGNTTNPRGLNRSGKVNTNISSSGKGSVEGNLMNRVNNLQQ